MYSDLPVFILHHKPLSYRKEALIADLLDVKFPYATTWVEGFKPETVYSHQAINPGETSLSFKHYHVLNRQIEDSLPHILLLEDDVDLRSVEAPISFLEQCLQQMKDTGGELCWVGGTKELTIREPQLEGKVVYYHESYTTRCTHAFMVSLAGAKKIVDNYHFNNQVDIMLNGLIQSCPIRSAWTSPFFYQKSHTYEGWRSSLR